MHFSQLVVTIWAASAAAVGQTPPGAGETAYAVGQIDFLTYIRSALDLDAYAGELVTRRAGAWRALAALQKAAGLPLIEGTPTTGEEHAQK